MFKERARAKINLTLHVGAPINDADNRFFGYHPLDSLVAFAEIGDELSCDIAETTSLKISGAFAEGLEADASNLVLRAYQAVSSHADLPSLNFDLVKNLPIASGIGGGSADAAAALRLLKNYVELPDAVWFDIAMSLGADVPVCLASKTSHMTGIGQIINPLDSAEFIHAVLVNPGVAVSTPDIFKAYDQNCPEDLPRNEDFKGDLLSLALKGRNDLEPIAIQMVPEIGQGLRCLSSQNGCLLARMSGSGATCFGLFANKGHASAACARLSDLRPDWWVVSSGLGDAP